MRTLSTIFLILIFISCKEHKKNNKYNINVIEHDTIYKRTKTHLDIKYTLIGNNDNPTEIVLSEKTNQIIQGKFGFGMFETKKPENKAFIFQTDYKFKVDSLPELSNPNLFSLVNEFEKSTSENNLKSVLIERDDDALTNVKAYKLTFAFIKNKKDTIGFQNTYQLVINNRFSSINYLNESRENYIEMEKEFEGFVLRVK